MRKLIAGNWKMNGSHASALALAKAVAEHTPAGVGVVLCPPSVLIPLVAEAVRGSAVAIGGQDCHAEELGAFTGDIAAAMLKDSGCAYVIVGHSERRQLHGESDQQVAAKALAAMAAGLIPIICVGESLAERDAGAAEAVVARQLRDSVPLAAQNGQFVLAYEPIWAIGTGRTPTTADIAAMHAHIGSLTGGRAPVLYGGSVKASNAREILGIPGVGGVLVGGASLVAEEFLAIAAAATA